MNTRIRELRKHYKLTQEEFGRRVGVSRDSVATYENGRVTPPEAVIRLICREFCVDYIWLKEGIGEMFANEEDEALAALDDLMTGEHKETKALIKALAKLDDSELEVVDKLIASIKKELGD